MKPATWTDWSKPWLYALAVGMCLMLAQWVCTQVEQTVHDNCEADKEASRIELETLLRSGVTGEFDVER